MLGDRAGPDSWAAAIPFRVVARAALGGRLPGCDRGAGAATAAQALLGKDFRVSRQRGELVDSSLARFVTATVHPSSILRAWGRGTPAQRTAFVADRRTIADLLAVRRV